MLIYTGLGDAESARLAQISSQIGAPVGSAVAGSIAASSGAFLGLSATVAVPVVGAAIAGVGLLIAHFLQPSKEGQEKIAATQIVNQTASLMQQNLAAYLGSPYSPINQQTAKDNFNKLWDNQVAALSQGLEDAGARGISERQRGGKYDQWKDNFDPILNDPRAAEYTKQQESNSASILATNAVGGINTIAASLSSGSSELLQSFGFGSGGNGLLIAGAAVLVGLVLMLNKKGH